MKICSKCNIEKEFDFFGKSSRNLSGYRSECKECSKQYRIDNKEKLKEYFKVRGVIKKEDISKRTKEYYKLNREVIKEKSAIYYETNREIKLEYQKEYQRNNREGRNEYLKERRNSDPLFKLSINIRNLINNSFYKNGYKKSSRTKDILGCSFDEFKIYIESKFQPWMDWKNRGLYNSNINYGWDIDHIIPLSSANSIDELIKLNHYTNLQPMCSRMNRDIKKNKLEKNGDI